MELSLPKYENLYKLGIFTFMKVNEVNVVNTVYMIDIFYKIVYLVGVRTIYSVRGINLLLYL